MTRRRRQYHGPGCLFSPGGLGIGYFGCSGPVVHGLGRRSPRIPLFLSFPHFFLFPIPFRSSRRSLGAVSWSQSDGGDSGRRQADPTVNHFVNSPSPTMLFPETLITTRNGHAVRHGNKAMFSYKRFGAHLICRKEFFFFLKKYFFKNIFFKKIILIKLLLNKLFFWKNNF